MREEAWLPAGGWLQNTPHVWDHYTTGQREFTLNEHCEPHTAHCTLYTVYCILHTAHCILYTAHCVLCTAHCTRYTKHCTLHQYSVHWTLHNAWGRLSTTQSIIDNAVCKTAPPTPDLLNTEHHHMMHMHMMLIKLHSEHCKLPTAPCTLHISYCILHTAHWTLHTAHWTLNTAHCTLHPTRQILWSQDFTLHALHITFHWTTAYSTLCLLHTANCTLHAPDQLFPLSHCMTKTIYFSIHYSLFSLHTLNQYWTMHTMHIYNTLCTVHTSLCTLHSSHNTRHTALYTWAEVLDFICCHSHQFRNLNLAWKKHANYNNLIGTKRNCPIYHVLNAIYIISPWYVNDLHYLHIVYAYVVYIIFLVSFVIYTSKMYILAETQTNLAENLKKILVPRHQKNLVLTPLYLESSHCQVMASS